MNGFNEKEGGWCSELDTVSWSEKTSFQRGSILCLGRESMVTAVSGSWPGPGSIVPMWQGWHYGGSKYGVDQLLMVRACPHGRWHVVRVTGSRWPLGEVVRINREPQDAQR